MDYTISNFIAEKVGNQVCLTWMYVGPEVISHYRIYKNGGVLRDYITIPTLFDKGVEVGSIYTYHITYVNKDGQESSNSIKREVTL